MDTPCLQAANTRDGAWPIVWSGLVALAIAMGIGRFAFTPLLPLMLRDGTLGVAAGAEWAAANYAGYLAGALSASRFAADPARGLLWALIGVALTTLLVPATGEGPPFVGALWRAGAGLFSAWALVCASSWCLAELARRGKASLGAWIYTGVGLGIALAGAFAWLGGRQSANALWLELGGLALAGSLIVDRALRGRGAVARMPAIAPRHASPAPTRARGPLGLVVCYGTFGFGYIVPATFLPAMARQQAADPLVFGLTWPLFGLAAAVSVAAAARWLTAWPRRRVWAVAQGVMALGTAVPLASQALWALAASAVLVGSTFMVATMAGLQLVREHRPADPTPLLARMTVAFALGQIAGPVLVRVLGPVTWGGLDAIAWASAAATLLLLVTAAWLWREPSLPSHDPSTP